MTRDNLAWQPLINDLTMKVEKQSKELNKLRRAVRPILFREKRAREHEQCKQLGEGTMENKELIEEVARAIFDADEYCDFPFQDATEDTKIANTKSAKAALSVIAPHYEKRISELSAENEKYEELYQGTLKKIADLKAQIPQWLPIEAAPKDGTEILVYDDGDIIIADYSHWTGAEGEKIASWFVAWTVESYKYCEPTMWMPLPKPPTE